MRRAYEPNPQILKNNSHFRKRGRAYAEMTHN